MEFTTNKQDNIFLRLIFGFIKTVSWEAFDLRISFLGRLIDKELGGGFEAREFKVSTVQKKELNYKSPREVKEEQYKTKLDREHQNRLKGGAKNSKNWELKRLKKQREIAKKKVEGE